MTQSFQIREARPADASAWASLRSALWPDGDGSHPAEISRYFTQAERSAGAMPEVVFVALDRSHISSLLGFAEVSRRAYAEGCDSSPVGFLEGWYVVPERRRLGIGRALVAAAEAWARELGCREFASDALADNSVSAAAHQALGFDEVVVIRCFRKELGTPEPKAQN